MSLLDVYTIDVESDPLVAVLGGVAEASVARGIRYTDSPACASGGSDIVCVRLAEKIFAIGPFSGLKVSVLELIHIESDRVSCWTVLRLRELPLVEIGAVDESSVISESDVFSA